MINAMAQALQLSPAKLSPQQHLAAQLDSLMAFELRRRIETDLQVSLAIDQFFGETTIAQLARRILEQSAIVDLAQSTPMTADLSEELEEISL